MQSVQPMQASSIDHATEPRLFLHGFVHRQRVATQQVRQCHHRGFAAGGALVDLLLASGNGLGVGPAARMAALAALGLGQQ